MAGMRHLIWIVALIVVTPAFAKKSVVVSAPPALGKLLSKQLAQRYTVVPLKTPLGPAPTAKEVREVTAPVSAIAVMTVAAGRKYVTAQILSGHDGTPLDTVTWRVNPRKPLPPDALQSIFDALAQGTAPAKAAPPPRDAPVADAPVADVRSGSGKQKKEPAVAEREEPSQAEETTVTGEAETPRTPSTRPAIRAGVGVHAFSRSFNWAGSPSDSLATYALPFAAAVNIDAQWFPGAHFTDHPIASNTGVFVNADVGVGVASRQDDSRFGTRADRLRFGAMMRFPMLKDRLELGAHLGYATQTFAISPVAANDGSPRPNIPSVTFNGPRLGGGARFQLIGTLAADATLGLQYVYGKGELASERYFPRTSAFSMDVTAGVSMELVQNIHARVGFDWTRYFLNLNPQEGMPFTAGSAADQYLGGSLSLSWVM